jgi:heme oxygenase
VKATPIIKLSETLGRETHELHRAAERTGFMNSLLRGVLPLERYTLLLRNMYVVYQRLEMASARAAAGSPLAWLAGPALARAPRIADDLTTLHGGDWADALPVVASARAHEAGLDRLETEWPLGLVAHAWVRYMGDVSGGQILAGVLQRRYGIQGPDGLRFYDFADLGDLDAFKASFRARIDTIPQAQHGGLVEEARAGFRHAITLFEELDRD